MSCDKRHSALLVAVSLAVGCATAPPPEPATPASTIRETPRTFEGRATFYGKPHQGGPTASGERFNMYAFTAAHRTLPMQTRVRCTNLSNGRSVEVRINDRGPFGRRRERVIDLSWAAARELDMLKAGVVPVRCEVLR